MLPVPSQPENTIAFVAVFSIAAGSSTTFGSAKRPSGDTSRDE